jgi:glycosyltransferase involved in cell wall biosynthesis
VSVSFCVPTLNRVNSLSKTVDSILKLNSTFNFEICISDNASDDGTKKYLESINNNKIKIYTQKERVNIDLNMLQVISMATKELIYPIGDDDLIYVDRLIIELEKLESIPDVFVFNGIRNNLENLKNPFLGKIFNCNKEAFKQLWDKMPFGSFLFRRELFNRNSFNKFTGTGHAYSGMIWQELSSRNNHGYSVTIKCGKEILFLDSNIEKSWNKNEIRIIFYDIPKWFTLLKNSYECIEEGRIKKLYLKNLCKTSQIINYYKRITNLRNEIILNSFFLSIYQLKKIKLIIFLAPTIVMLSKKLKYYVSR